MTAPAPARSTGLTLQVRIASGLAVLVGLWLILSPFIFGTGFRRGAMVNDPIVGIVVVLLAAGRFVSDPTTVWPSWATVPFGIWTLISPWVYGFATESPGLRYDSVVLGLVLIALSVWGALAGLEVEDRIYHHSFG